MYLLLQLLEQVVWIYHFSGHIPVTKIGMWLWVLEPQTILQEWPNENAIFYSLHLHAVVLLIYSTTNDRRTRSGSERCFLKELQYCFLFPVITTGLVWSTFFFFTESSNITFRIHRFYASRKYFFFFFFFFAGSLQKPAVEAMDDGFLTSPFHRLLILLAVNFFFWGGGFDVQFLGLAFIFFRIGVHFFFFAGISFNWFWGLVLNF